jgi:hypothetical protein
MSGFSVLRRIKTSKHIRTRRSILTNTGPSRALWPRLQETERLEWEGKRREARRRLHVQR